MSETAAAIAQASAQQSVGYYQQLSYNTSVPQSESYDTNKLFVGGLAQHVNDFCLKQFCEQWGSVQDVKIMIDRMSGKSRGFGFVTFSDPTTSVQLLASGSHHHFEGRNVEFKYADNNLNRGGAMGSAPRSQIQQSAVHFQVGDGSPSEPGKIFCGGLPPSVNRQSLADYFSKYGDVVDAIVMNDPVTGVSRGFGFVTFSSEVPVELVISQYSSHYIDDKWIECKKCMPRGMSTPARGKGRGEDVQGRGSGKGAYSYGQPSYPPPQQTWAPQNMYTAQLTHPVIPQYDYTTLANAYGMAAAAYSSQVTTPLAAGFAQHTSTAQKLPVVGAQTYGSAYQQALASAYPSQYTMMMTYPSANGGRV